MGGPDRGEGAPRRGGDGNRRTLRHLHLGTQLALSLVLCLFGGSWLDGKTGWSPVFTLVGAVLGIALGMGIVILEVSKSER